MNRQTGTPTVSAMPAVMETAQPVSCGPLSALIVDGAVRRVMFNGIEVVRGIDCPMRDANWGTAVPEDVTEEFDIGSDGARYQRRFSVFGGAMTVALEARFTSSSVHLSMTARADRRVETNRAGFTLLHPLNGVAGKPLTIVHSDGSEEETAFPSAILAGQPAFDIAGLKHSVHGVAVEIAFGGEIFEMEDQRNWTDASFKTYCRPLGLPFPYAIEAGETVTQSIDIRVSGEPQTAQSADASAHGSPALPEIAMVATPAWLAVINEPLLVRSRGVSRLVRVDLAEDDLAKALAGMATLGATVELELVVDDDGDIEGPLANLAEQLRASGVVPASIVALPRAYLKSYQPTDQWPAGRSIAQAAQAVARAFPDARIGVGMLTNFTELNRHAPPAKIGDFVTYSTSAIVHAADDRSVFETLETLSHVHKSATALASDRPLRLGLASIGMRSNPYGAAVADNPDLQRIAMATDDPRQRTVFGAAFAVGAYAAAADCGVARIALASLGGPFATGEIRDGRFMAWPIHHAIVALASVSAGQRVAGPALPPSVYGVQADIDGKRIGVFANCGLEDATAPLGSGTAIVMSDQHDASDPDWLENAQPVSGETLTLAPGSVLFTKGDAA